jgi:DNA gyrase/topoisomerase IV subunit A
VSVSMNVDEPTEQDMILSVTEHRSWKADQCSDEYRTQSRGGRSVINVQDDAQERKVVAIMRQNQVRRRPGDDCQRQAHPRALHG